MGPAAEACGTASSQHNGSSSNQAIVQGSLNEGLSGGSNRLQKQRLGLLHGNKIKSLGSAMMPETGSKCQEHGSDSSTHCGTENAEKLSSQLSATSTSKEEENEKEDCCKAGSLVAPSRISENVKDGVSLEGGGYPLNYSVKVDINDKERQALTVESRQLVRERMNELTLVAAEDEHRSLKTESCSSNVPHIAFSASSNESCQQALADAKSLDHSKPNSFDSYRCTKSNYSVEDSASKRSASSIPKRFASQKYGIDSSSEEQDLRKANFPNREDTEFPKAPYVRQDPSEVDRVVAREGEEEVMTCVETPGSCCSIYERSGAIAKLMSVDSAISYKENGSRNQFSNGQLNRSSSCSTTDNMAAELSIKNQGEEPPENILSKNNRASHRERPLLINEKPDDSVTNHEHPCASSIDLNELICTSEVDYQQSISGAITCYSETVPKPKPVVAKSGASIFFPELRLQLNEETSGWKGSAATSAFRPTGASSSLESNSETKSSQVRGFDLNIPAVGNDVQKCVQAMPSFISEESVDTSAEDTKRFKIDLNSVVENVESCPASLSRHLVGDFDLNNNPMSTNVRCHVDQPSQATTIAVGDRATSKSASAFLVSRQSDSNWVPPSCYIDSNYMQSKLKHANTLPVTSPNFLTPTEQVQNALFWQQKAVASMPSLQNMQPFPYRGAFFIHPNNQLPSGVYPPGIIPLMANARANVFPQILGSNVLPAFSSVPCFTQVPAGPACGIDVTNAMYVDQNGRLATSRTGSTSEIGVQQYVPVNFGMTEDQMACYQQLALVSPPMKRGEPEGGSDSYQHGFKRMAPDARFS